MFACVSLNSFTSETFPVLPTAAAFARVWDSFNVVDSVSTRGLSLLPAALAAWNQRCGDAFDHHVSLAYVLSPAKPGVFGTLHLDPPYGSNWQYLCCGLKTWATIDPASGFILSTFAAFLVSGKQCEQLCFGVAVPIHCVSWHTLSLSWLVLRKLPR